MALSKDATIPTRGSALAAGYDLYAAVDIDIGPHDKGLVSTGLQIAVPDGCYGRIAQRSGLAVKNFIHVGGKSLSFCFGPVCSVKRVVVKILQCRDSR